MSQDYGKYEKEYERRGEYQYSRQCSMDLVELVEQTRVPERQIENCIRAHDSMRRPVYGHRLETMGCMIPESVEIELVPIQSMDSCRIGSGRVGHQGYGHQQQFGRDYNQGEYEERLMRVFARYPDIDYNHMMRNERMRFEPHEIEQMEREIRLGIMPHKIFKIYEETLLNDEKTSETKQIAAKWEITPPIISSNSASFQKTNDSWQEIENGKSSFDRQKHIEGGGGGRHTNGGGGGSQEEWEFEDVVLEEGTSGLGFLIAGGYDMPHVGNDPSIYVTNIIVGGAAARDGRLKKDDIILRVNTTDTVDVSHHAAVVALNRAGNVIKLFVKRKRLRSVSPPSSNADTGNVERIELVKGNKGLGFGIAGGIGDEHIPGDAGIFVTEIIDSGAAQLDGRLRLGDKLVAVGGHELYNVTHETAMAALRATSERVVLNIIKNPHPDLLLNASYDTPPVDASSNVDGGGGGRYYPPAREVAGSPAEHRTYERAPPSGTYVPQLPADHTPYKSSVPPPSTSTGYQPVPRSGSPDITRAQRTVVLQKGPAGLGFYIVGGEDGEGIYISYILPGGIADVSGSLFKGDQLIQVNGEDLCYATHEIAVQALKNSGPRVHIVAQYKPDGNTSLLSYIPQAAAHGHQQQQKVSPGAEGNRHPGGGAPLKEGSVYRAMYDYSAAYTDEVSFKEGDVILNCQSVDQGWMTGTVQRTNQWGMLPANCVEKVH